MWYFVLGPRWPQAVTHVAIAVVRYKRRSSLILFFRNTPVGAPRPMLMRVPVFVVSGEERRVWENESGNERFLSLSAGGV